MPAYEPGRFSSTYETGKGSEIWAFLNAPESVVRMETATYLSRPAVEPLSPVLLDKFGETIREDRMKQMIGHMVRQVMEARGYVLDRSNVRITTPGNMFASATRYKTARSAGKA
jgi:hypothetical protein